MHEDNSGTPNDANNPKDESSDADSKGLTTNQQSEPYNQPSSHEKNSTNTNPKPIFPVRVFRRIRTWWIHPNRPRPHVAEWITVFLSLVIAFIAGVQAYIYHQQKAIMESSSGQTDQLIKAANIQACAATKNADAAARNADAADSFSQSAVSIKKGIAATEKDFSQIAKLQERALNAAIESADQDRRPWVGLPNFRCDECTSDTNGTISVGNLFGIMENSGKTPAIKMVVNAAWADRLRSDPIPDYDSLGASTRDPYKAPDWMRPADAEQLNKTLALTKKFTEAPMVVLPPNAVRQLPIIGSIKASRIIIAKYEDQKIFYVVGKITYSSTSKPDIVHTTKFCLMNEFGANFRFCPTGNDMN
jgi:hypothetical protein